MMGKDGRKSYSKRLHEGAGWSLAISKLILGLEEQKLRAAGITVPFVAGSPIPAFMPVISGQ